jgi:hypothetical protein
MKGKQRLSKLGCEIWLTKLYNDIKALYACKYCVQGCE